MFSSWLVCKAFFLIRFFKSGIEDSYRFLGIVICYNGVSNRKLETITKLNLMKEKRSGFSPSCASFLFLYERFYVWNEWIIDHKKDYFAAFLSRNCYNKR